MKALTILLISISVVAGPVQVNSVHSFSSFKKGELNGVALNSQGEIVMSHQLKKVVSMNETYIWDICSDGQNLFVAAGEKGKIYRYKTGLGEAKLLTHFEEGTVYAICLYRGKLYASLSPSGKIYEVDRETGKTTEKLTLKKGKYIWRMVSHGDSIYVATGLPGSVLKLDRNFLVTVLAKDVDTHVESLLVTDSRIVAGTSPSGYLLEIHPDRKPFLLTDTPFSEIKDIVEVNGLLYAACFNGKVKEQTPPKVKPAQEVKSASVLKGGIVTVDSQNVPETRIQFSTMAPFSFTQQGGNILVGTGHSGKLLTIDTGKQHELTISGEVDCGQIIRFVQMNNSILLATANPGEIYHIEKNFALSGTFTSVPFDAGKPTHWGAFYFDSTAPRGSRTEFLVRAGNSASPDATWSSWQKIENGQTPELPATTLVQWQARLISQDPGTTATVTGVRFYYRETNLPPVLNAVSTLPSGIFAAKTAATNPDAFIPAQAETAMGKLVPPTGMKTGFRPGMQAVLARASDPNNDKLRFTFVLESASGRKLTLKQNSETALYSMDTHRIPEGRYRFQVTVSDSKENYPDAGTDSGKGRWFRVDHTSPTITLQAPTGGKLAFTVRDSLSVVAKVEISTDGGEKWQEVWPDDGIPDSGNESYHADIAGIKDVIIRAYDDHGNSTTVLGKGGIK
ncbi:MAG: hypothetical protein CO090_04970 [Acidobacteria bacterium CG_4_9_14_3_um_filter_49_7]|nr:MAG: hypothetical protein CO090_04970 [Acidobacteria bacterium CG_4_9_14_3_um_filter_49_7]